MARLPLVSDHPDDPDLARIFGDLRERGREPSNLYRTLGHAPRMLAAWVGMAWPLRTEPSVRRGLRELMILRSAQLTGARYEWAHHRDMATAAGVPEAALRALADWRSSDLFDPRERAALAYTEEIVANEVGDGTFEEVRRLFSPAEVIELTLTASFYAGVGRVLRALRVDLESEYAGDAGLSFRG
jgi:alkylhydroperoxidase family enzyme